MSLPVVQVTFHNTSESESENTKQNQLSTNLRKYVENTIKYKGRTTIIIYKYVLQCGKEGALKRK